MSFKMPVAAVLHEFDIAPTLREKIEVLQDHDSPELRTLLFYSLDPNVESVVDLIPEYNKQAEGHGFQSLAASFKLAYLFFKGASVRRYPENLSDKRRAAILIQILESLEPYDAEVWTDMLKRDLKINYLTPKLVNKAFPGLLSK